MEKNKEVKKIVIPTPRSMWSNPHGFICNSGNGKSVLQYEVDEKTGCPVVKKDEHGKPVYFNFYETIQKFAKVNDYKKFLEMNGDPAMLEDDGSKFADVSNAGSLEDVLNARAKVAATGNSVDDIYKEFLSKLEKVIGSKKEPEKKQEEKVVSKDPVEQLSKDDVKKDEKK